MLWISQQIWFSPVPESAYNAQNAQFGLVMYNLNESQSVLNASQINLITSQTNLTASQIN